MNSVGAFVPPPIAFIKISKRNRNGTAKVFEHTFDLLGDRHRSKDNHVGICPSRADATLGHRRYSRPKLFDNGLRGSASLPDITLASTLETNIVGRVDVDSSTKMMPQFGPIQSEKTLNDHAFCRAKRLNFASTSVNGEIVNRHIDRLSLVKIGYLRNQQIVLEGSGLVEVRTCALLKRQMREIAIVMIEGQHGRSQSRCKMVGEMALPCSRWAGDANEVRGWGHAATV